jgi:signal transduction histidine kinase
VDECFDLQFAGQGAQALELLCAANENAAPFALAFVDVRMPPGWDGVETIQRLWQVDARLQVVLCTAFADYSWQEMIDRLGRSDRLLILKKPFDPIEVRQLASALTEKWNSSVREQLQLAQVQRAELEARAYAASLETVNHALDTARRAAQAESAAKSELLLLMARRLSPAMLELVGFAEALNAHEADETSEWLERVDLICRDGGQLRRSLQDVLDLSELEANSMELATESFCPRALVDAALEERRSTAALRSLALELSCSADWPELVHSDRKRIAQILDHLLSNAIEHSAAHGFVRVVLGVRTDIGRSQKQLCIEVIDSGPGLSRDQESLLFEPFSNSAGAHSGRAHFGLGLCVSKRIAQRLGGDLNVESATGSGCRFVFTLQVGVAAAARSDS